MMWRTWLALALFLFGFACETQARELDRYSDLDWMTSGNTATGVPSKGAGPLGYGNSSGGPHAFGKKPLPWPGKSQAENMAKWKSMATPGNMAKRMMNPLGGAITLLGGMAMNQLIAESCVRVFGGTITEGAVWDECNMIPVTGWITGGYQASKSSTQAGSCELYNSLIYPGRGYTTSLRMSGTTMFCDINNGSPPYNNITGFAVQQSGTVLVQDQENPWRPVSDNAALEAKLTTNLTTWCSADMAQGESYQGNCTKVLKELMDSGQVVSSATDLPLTGPASHTAPPVTKTETKTITTPQGTTTSVVTTTTTTTYNYTYNGQTVTTTTKTTETNTTTTPEGTTVEEKETTTDDEPETSPATDSALPALPKLYEPKYPQGLQGVWDTQVALIKATPLFALPAQLSPNWGDSGGCPAWSISVNVGLANWGVHDVSMPCFVWSFLRVCTIIGALFLARALIFGG